MEILGCKRRTLYNVLNVSIKYEIFVIPVVSVDPGTFTPSNLRLIGAEIATEKVEYDEEKGYVMK